MAKRTQAQLLADIEKPNKREQLKTQRDVLIASPINNVQVGRIEDREKIQGAVQYFDTVSSEDGTKLWIMADNSIAHLTKSEMESLIPSYVMRVDAVYNAYAKAVSALESASTLEEIQLIEVTLDA